MHHFALARQQLSAGSRRLEIWVPPYEIPFLSHPEKGMGHNFCSIQCEEIGCMYHSRKYELENTLGKNAQIQ